MKGTVPSAATAAAALLLLAASPASSVPLASQHQSPFAATTSPALGDPGKHHDDFDPLEHCSGISPYHDAPGANIEPPRGCTITSAAFLIRHSSIYANDDEWEDYMEPFSSRLSAFSKEERFKHPTLEWINDWESPINEGNLEKLTGQGEKDATSFGKRLRSLYPGLFPPRDLGRGKATTDKVKTPFRVWTASSSRDIGTAKAFIRGAFPKWQRGDEGEGDGKYVELVEVNNKDPDWSASLTPHKVCPAFSKEPGKPDAAEWLSHFGVAPLDRLRAMEPNFAWELNDVIAIAMLCGYESVIKGIGRSRFCSKDLLDHDDFRAFGYWNDLIYHKMVGYAAPVAPYLGVSWLNTSTHNLFADDDDSHDLHPAPAVGSGGDDLPGPERPPNATHSQLLFPYFTHREEPPVALVALGLWNQTERGPLPTDRIATDRVWQTSHVLPFLGHVALERLECRGDGERHLAGEAKEHEAMGEGKKAKKAFVRAVVNGAAQPLPYCHDGPGGSCEAKTFVKWVRQRVERYQDFQGACENKEDQ